MSATQLVTPNLDPVIYQSGHMLTDWYGWCLAYVQTAFGTGWAGSNATEAWTNHIPDSAKHLNREIPSGMYVPIYFSGYHGLGHFGIYKDGYVWCTPIEHKPTADVWDSISTVEHKYGVTYVGWTEMLGGTQVVEYTPDVTIEPTPPQPTYQVTETYPDGKQIQLNKQPTNLWGMNYDFDYMKDHPVEVHNQGEIWTVTNKVHHQDGYDYYRRADQVDGFNVLDCDDYTPPPLPYIPPAAPIVAAKAEKYKLVTTVKYYGSLEDAQKDHNALGTISRGEYFVFATEGIFKNLSTSNMDNQNKWINVLENKVIVTPPTTRLDPPELTKEVPNPIGDVPPPSNWRGTLNLGFAGMFVFIQDTDVIDLEGNNPLKKATNGDYLQISGKFTGPDGKEYARPINKPGYFMWYGVPIENLRPYDEVYGTKTTIQEREVLHTLTKADKIELWLAKIKKFSAPVWDIVAPKRSKK